MYTPPNPSKSSDSPAEAQLNEKTSAANSVGEKELDLEEGKHPSISSSKTDVISDDPRPDSNVVNWEGPDDPKNPMNWSSRLKWGNIAVISSITFLT